MVTWVDVDVDVVMYGRFPPGGKHVKYPDQNAAVYAGAGFEKVNEIRSYLMTFKIDHI